MLLATSTFFTHALWKKCDCVCVALQMQDCHRLIRLCSSKAHLSEAVEVGSCVVVVEVGGGPHVALTFTNPPQLLAADAAQLPFQEAVTQQTLK